MSPLDNLINGYMDEAADPRSNISVIILAYKLVLFQIKTNVTNANFGRISNDLPLDSG